MANRPISLLLVEDDENEIELFKSYIDTIDDIKLVAITNSSQEGIEYVKEYSPEAIILDIELHQGQGSGIEFIDDLKKYTNSFKPMIIVTTNASSKLLYTKLHDSGADLIFYKKQTDYSPQLVISALLSLRESLYKFNNNYINEKSHIETVIERKTRVSDRVNSELDKIGISSHLKGRTYIYEAIIYLLEQKEKDTKVSVFNYLANKYKKASSSISRVMQTAINYAWKTSSTEDLELYYTAKINYKTGVPSPTELVYYYYKKIEKNI